jgi:hypothetical protein
MRVGVDEWLDLVALFSGRENHLWYASTSETGGKASHEAATESGCILPATKGQHWIVGRDDEIILRVHISGLLTNDARAPTAGTACR